MRNLESLLENDGKTKLIITEGRSTQDFEVYESKYKQDGILFFSF